MQIRKSILVSFCWFLMFSMQAQLQASPCQEHALTYARSFAVMVRENNTEAMPRLLFEWEQTCGMSEPLFRARTLQLIAEEMFPTGLNEDQLLEQAIAFEIRYKLLEEDLVVRDDYYSHHMIFFGYVPLGEEFDRQTQRWAGRMLAQRNRNDLAKLFLQLYAGQTAEFFALLHQNGFSDTSLGVQYRERADYFLAKPEFSLGVMAGGWFPGFDLDSIGNHPTLGVMLGVKHGKNYFDGVFAFRFGKTPSPVMILVQDTLLATRNHQGGYLGAEYSRVLKQFERSQLELFLGVGYDVIELVEEGQDPQRVTSGSFALHGGASFRYFFPNRTWLHLKPVFYLLQHGDGAGVSLKGNAVGVQLIFGYTENPRKSQNLRRLGYEKW